MILGDQGTSLSHSKQTGSSVFFRTASWPEISSAVVKPPSEVVLSSDGIVSLGQQVRSSFVLTKEIRFFIENCLLSRYIMKQIELEKKLTRQKNALDYLSKTLSENRRLEEIAQRIARVAVSVTEAQSASVWLLNHDFAQAVSLSEYNSRSRIFSSGSVISSGELLSLFKKCTRNEFIALTNGCRKDSAGLGMIDRLGTGEEVGSLAAVPVCLNHELKAAIFLSHNDQGKIWNVDEQYFIKSIATLLSNYLECMESRRVKTELFHKENIYRAIFENTGTATIIIDGDRTISIANSEFIRLSRYSKEEIEGKMEVGEFFHPQERDRINRYHSARQRNPAQAPRKFEAVFQRKNDEERNVLITVEMIPGTSQSVASFSDVTNQKRVLEQLTHQALHDELTGLPNRVLFLDRLEQCLVRSKKDPRFVFAVLFLDLDRFKMVNESFGHRAGDQMLIAMTQRIQTCVGHCDTIARFGGDEFAVLLEGISSIMEVTRVAERINEEMSKPYLIEGDTVFPSVSIGIVFSNNQQEYRTAEEIIRDTDIAMYRTKGEIGVKFKVFSKAMHRKAVAQLKLESDLRMAHDQGELVPYFQPIVSLDDFSLSGFEALLRWHHPQKGVIDPGVFIPVAEDTGMIVPIGLSTLQQTCLHLSSWQKEYPDLEGFRLAVNISSKQVTHPGFLQQVEQTLKEYDCPTGSIILEITESALLRNEFQVRNILKSLKSMGVGICIDDFGTGYSSLSYLHMFPIDTLKIDKIFTSGRGQDKITNEKIVRTIIHLAKDMGIGVVVEGVETMTQLHRLIELDGEKAQGFFFSAPVPADGATRIIDSSRQRSWAPQNSALLSLSKTQ